MGQGRGRGAAVAVLAAEEPVAGSVAELAAEESVEEPVELLAVEESRAERVAVPEGTVAPWPALFLVREVPPAYGVPAAAHGAPEPAPDPTVPDPATEDAGARADRLLALGDRIAELARSIQVAEAEMMRLIARFDRERGWAERGFGSCAEWLEWRISVGPNAARERVRTALALEELPRTAAAMASGTLSYAKARALTRVATPDSEEALLALAQAGSAAHLERIVRAWKAMDDARELTVEQARHRSRRFSVFVDDDGSYVVRGRLDPEVGAVLMRAVEAASDAIYGEEADGDEVTPAQRRADAVGLLAERALAAGFGETTGGSRAERYQVLLHVEPDTLRSDRPSGRSELDGVRVCRETSRRLTCDAGVVRIAEERVSAETSGTHRAPADPARSAPRVSAETSGTRILGVGRRTRTVPPALRRALQARDRCCRFPGCGSRFTEAHHIVHWADGGRTDLPNLLLLCWRHHRAVHEGRMRVCLDRDRAVVFFDPHGRAVAAAPAPASAPATAAPPRLPPAPPVATAAPFPGADRYRRARDIPWAIEARALEALDSG